MRNKGITRFVMLSLLALLPVLLMFGLYVSKDPFNVIRPYDGNAPASADTVQLTINTGYVSTEAFRLSPHGISILSSSVHHCQDTTASRTGPRICQPMQARSISMPQERHCKAFWANSIIWNVAE